MTSTESQTASLALPGGADGAEEAARLLSAPDALTHLSLEEARAVVAYMKPRFYPAGTAFIKEGDSGDGGFMALLVDGEVLVERITVSNTEPVTIRVLGPGSLIGEMGLVDNEARSATCTASTDIWCAILTRNAVRDMLDKDPSTAARLLLGMSAHIAERLRDTNRQLKLYARLAVSMREELTHYTEQSALKDAAAKAAAK